MTPEQDILFTTFDKLSIKTQTYTHEPVFTVEQILSLDADLPGAHCKNLFLKDDKKNYYLLVALHTTAIVLKKVAKALHIPGLRFADAPALLQYLGVTPGAVSPFGIIDDKEHLVTLILDKLLFQEQILGLHPLENTATTTIAPQDLLKFIQACNNKYIVFDFMVYQVDQSS